QRGTAISEVRAAPARAPEALRRYWAIINAIGKVAERHGLIGVPLATHFNVGVVVQGTPDKLLKYEEHPDEAADGVEFLAAVQHNLEALQPFQMDSGLGETSTLEAYPDKQASTCVHHQRLEVRHPLVGIADPRIDMLAALHGLQQVQNDAVPKIALD